MYVLFLHMLYQWTPVDPLTLTSAANHDIDHHDEFSESIIDHLDQGSNTLNDHLDQHGETMILITMKNCQTIILATLTNDKLCY